MKKEKNDNLYKFSTQTPWQFAFVVILYLVGAVGIPSSNLASFFGLGKNLENLINFAIKTLCCILPIYLVFEVKLQRILSLKGFFNKFLYLIPFLLVVVNNFPILPIISGDVQIVERKVFQWITYLLSVFAGVCLEEITFRGLIFPVLYRTFEKLKGRAFWAVFASSSLFGVVHLFNLFAGSSFGSVVVQIGYSLLIGGMCAIAFLKTGNFYNAVLLHFIFNIGGLLYDYNMICGNVWTIENVIITAVLAVVVILYALYLLFKKPNGAFEEKCFKTEVGL